MRETVCGCGAFTVAADTTPLRTNKRLRQAINLRVISFLLPRLAIPRASKPCRRLREIWDKLRSYRAASELGSQNIQMIDIDVE